MHQFKTIEDHARFVEEYTDPKVPMDEMERRWKRPSGTLYRWGYELGLRRPKVKGQTALALDQVRRYCEQVSQALPSRTELQFKAPKFKPTGICMDMVLWLCDLHPGRLTSTYNSKVFAARMEALAIRITHRVMALRKMYTIRKLSIFALGDFVVGENIGRNITLEELEDTILNQVYKMAIPQLVKLVGRMILIFDEIGIDAVKGNHGVLSKFGPSQAANWDTVVYLGWQAELSHLISKIRFNIERVKWYNYARVGPIDWLLVHGDQIKATGGNPFNAVAAKAERWHRSMPKPFDLVATGHWHQFIKAGDVWSGPTMVSDDDWCREVLGRDGECGQLLMGITKDGIEYAAPIDLGDVREE